MEGMRQFSVLGRSENVTLVRVEFVLQCDCPTCPTVVDHVHFQLGSNVLKLLKQLVAIIYRGKCSREGGSMRSRRGSMIPSYLSAPILLRSSLCGGRTSFDAIPR